MSSSNSSSSLGPDNGGGLSVPVDGVLRSSSRDTAAPAPPAVQLPAEFVRFLEENALSASFYGPLLTLAHVPSRFVHPVSRPVDSGGPPVGRATQADIASELGIPPGDIKTVDWLPRPNLEFWRVPGHYRVHSPSFKTGAFLALDAGSGVAVHALSLEPDDAVLDLCFAPGGKGSLIGEAVRYPGRGTVTAVDASQQRLTTAMARSKRAGNHTKTRYCRTDGTTFDTGAPRLNVHWRAKAFGTSVEAERARDDLIDERWASWERDPLVERGSGGSSGSSGSSMRPKWHVTKRLQPIDETADVFVPYDKVLVDAECTHDGSVSHILKYIRPMAFTPSSRPGSPEAEDLPPPAPTLPVAAPPAASPPALAFPQPFLTSLAESRTILPELQLGLLRNGFRLLRPGGILVYATCSRAVEQGERLVERFLAEINDVDVDVDADGGDAEGDDDERRQRWRCVVEDVPGRERMPCAPRDGRFLGGKGLRFTGEYSPGQEDEWVSALFVCRLRKVR